MDGLGKYFYKGAFFMYHFEYVTKKQAKPVKEELLDIIHEVQDILREEFTFRYDFVGSSQRNMITQDVKSNLGFDFDVNIEPNDDNENYTAEELRTKIRDAINQVAPQYGYSYCEDSTRVLTIKKINHKKSKIIHSCDFAIVYTYKEDEQERQKYIRYNKQSNYYSWEQQGKSFENLPKKIKFLKDNGLWNELKDYYLDKKNTNTDPDKHSRSIFAESVKEVCDKNGYEDN